MSGYELARFLDSRTPWIWSAPSSQIYPQLRKMERAGLIQSESQIRGTKLERKVYSISDEGLAELRQWVATPMDTSLKRDAILLQAHFFDLVEPDRAIEILQHMIEEQKRLVEQWEEQVRHIQEHEAPLLAERLRHRPASEHERITELKAHVIEGGADLARARIAWGERAIELLIGRKAATDRARRSRQRREKVIR